MTTSGDAARAAVDGTAIAIWLGWATDALPSIATLFTVIWLGIQIWQSKVGQYHVACIKQRIARWRGRATHGADDHGHQDQDP